MQPDYEAIIRLVPKLRGVDFSPLLQPRLGYADQVKINKKRVWLLAACAVEYGLDFGLVVRFISSEVTAAHRDVEAILASARPYVDEITLAHMKRILERGCPAKFNWEEPDRNKESFIQRGNHSSVKEHSEVVWTTLNKEERNSH